MESRIPETLSLKNWTSPNVEQLPDFIIGGAMKCGTSSLHAILDKHPRVFIPKEEVHFFDIDNILQHSDFNYYLEQDSQWVWQDMESQSEKLWDWYHNKFAGKESLLKGEDSTTYLASEIAAKRIAAQTKEIKLIFLLRNPTSRVYSNYWHMLRTGRASYSFEDTIRYEPSTLLDRSLYKSQLETYYKHIPRERIKVILFEEFISNLEAEMEGVCDFLGIDYKEFPADALEVHANKALLPKNIRLQVLKNRLLKNSGHNRYLDSLPLKPKQNKPQVSFWEKAVNKLHYKLNPLAVRGKPKMKKETKIFLDKFFQRELEGIDELVGKNVMSIWFSRSLY